MAGMRKELKDLIETLHLEPLKGEGGYYRRVHTFNGDGKPLGSTIYYLMTSQSFSSLHFLPTAEVWYFLEGSPSKQLVLYPDGSHAMTMLGKASEGYQSVVAVDGGCWQGTKPLIEDGWTLCATTMVPPYDGQSYKQGTKALLASYPDCPFLEDFLSKE